MVRTRRLLGAAAFAVMGMGCSSNPLVGTWSAALTVGTVTGTEILEVHGNGTLGVTLTAMGGNCLGSWVTTGYSWAATDNSVTFSGTPTCTGSITCGALSQSCSGDQGLKAGACTYALSNNDDTLALTSCTGTSDVTLIRSN